MSTFPTILSAASKRPGCPSPRICQRALLAAVEAAEGGLPGFSEPIAAQFHRGWEAAVRWIETAPVASLLTLVRDQRLADIPAEALPDDLYALTQEQTLAWEAGFMAAGRATLRLPLPVTSSADSQQEPGDAEADVDGDSRASTDSAGESRA